MPALFRSREWRRPGTLALVAACVLVGLVAGRAALSAAIVASAGIVLHRGQRHGFLEALLVLTAAAVVGAAIILFEARGTFQPFGLEAFAPATTIVVVVTGLAPLAGAMMVLAASELIASRPVVASLAVAYGRALSCAVAAFAVATVAVIGLSLVAGDDRGLLLSKLDLVADSIPLAARAVLTLPLLTWIGARFGRPWPVICAIAAAIATVPP